MSQEPKAKKIREEILRLTREYSRLTHAAQRPGWDPLKPAFQSGETAIPYAGRVFDEEEVEAAVSSALDFWLTLGPEGSAFESEFADFLGVKHSVLTNSGSSANLLAVSALTHPSLPSHRRLTPGSEVITCAAGFPTTVAPILQNGLVPVFIDCDPVTANVRADQIERAYQEGKTKAVMLAHALGNPFDLGRVLAFCRKHDLWLIEDNCDALGSTYSMPFALANSLGFHHNSPGLPAVEGWITRYTGTWGDLSTQSFYPPHHMTMGEGGLVNVISHAPLKKYVEGYRDWGRDCWCPSGADNTCGRRFGWRMGELPAGYDHKYIYSVLGFNLKPLDLQASIGRAQFKKLPAFIESRKKNWDLLRQKLEAQKHWLDFSLPTHAIGWTMDQEIKNQSPRLIWDKTECRSCPSWFGFMIRPKSRKPVDVDRIVGILEKKKIGNRRLFGGNLLRQPVLVNLKKENPNSFRSFEHYPGADEIMNSAVFVGCYPGLSEDNLQYIAEAVALGAPDLPC